MASLSLMNNKILTQKENLYFLEKLPIFDILKDLNQFLIDFQEQIDVDAFF